MTIHYMTVDSVQYITIHDMKINYNTVKGNKIQYITVQYFIVE